MALVAWVMAMVLATALVASVAWGMAMAPAMALGAMVAMATSVPLSMADTDPQNFTENMQSAIKSTTSTQNQLHKMLLLPYSAQGFSFVHFVIFLSMLPQ